MGFFFVKKRTCQLLVLLQDGAKNETNKMADNELALSSYISFGQNTKTTSRSERNVGFVVGSMFAGYTDTLLAFDNIVGLRQLTASSRRHHSRECEISFTNSVNILCVADRHLSLDASQHFWGALLLNGRAF